MREPDTAESSETLIHRSRGQANPTIQTLQYSINTTIIIILLTRLSRIILEIILKLYGIEFDLFTVFYIVAFLQVNLFSFNILEP
jgi:hypothetical protein